MVRCSWFVADRQARSGFESRTTDKTNDERRTTNNEQRTNMPESAKEKLKKLTAWTTEPALTDVEIDELLAASGLADAEGNAPSSEDWTPTYDINAAAAEGWLIKAGRAASTTETEPDSLQVTSRVFENCVRLARLYSTKRAASARVSIVRATGT